MITEIIDGIHIGDESDISALQKYKSWVTIDARHIISAGHKPEKNLEGCRMLASTIHTLKLLGKKIVVYCDAGIERSPLVVMYYLMVSKGWNFDYSYNFVKGRRNCVGDRFRWIKSALSEKPESIDYYLSLSSWGFPLDMFAVGTTDDSDSFKNIDLEHEVEIPVAPHVGAFGVKRSHDRHRGIDLYAPPGTEVYAVEDGKIVDIRPWTGPKANCDWWLDTDAVLVEGKSGLVVYGEIEVIIGEVEVGMSIEKGDVVGRVKRVLRNDKGRPTSMLHLELRELGFLRNISKDWDNEVPDGIKDPTDKLRGAMYD